MHTLTTFFIFSNTIRHITIIKCNIIYRMFLQKRMTKKAKNSRFELLF